MPQSYWKTSPKPLPSSFVRWVAILAYVLSLGGTIGLLVGMPQTFQPAQAGGVREGGAEQGGLAGTGLAQQQQGAARTVQPRDELEASLRRRADVDVVAFETLPLDYACRAVVRRRPGLRAALRALGGPDPLPARPGRDRARRGGPCQGKEEGAREDGRCDEVADRDGDDPRVSQSQCELEFVGNHIYG